MKQGLGFRILLVEDDPDVRSAFSEVLTEEGYEVETAGTAEEGLSRLNGAQFELIITDYKLPGQTGVWMLQAAAKAGLLATSKVLLITGEPNPDGVAGLKVLYKPIDKDLFLREVFKILAPARVKELEPDQAEASEGSAIGASNWEFVLYIKEGSEACVRALHNVKSALLKFHSRDVKLTVWDIAKAPPADGSDTIPITPTLVRQKPTPPLSLVSGLQDEGAVQRFLAEAGLRERAT